MGEQVSVGPLIYTVTDAEWKTDIGSDSQKMIPKERFLVIRLSITNSGGADAGSPLGILVDKQDKEFYEIQEVKGVPEWLPILRRLAPAATDAGRIVFDAPMGIYKLKVSGGGDPENEKFAFIEIPLELQAPTSPLEAPNSTELK